MDALRACAQDLAQTQEALAALQKRAATSAATPADAAAAALADWSSKYSALSSKLVEQRAQAQLLKNDVARVRRVLARELGPDADVDRVLAGESSSSGSSS